MKIVNDINIQKWNEFVKSHPNGNIFQTPEMFEVYKKTNNYKPLVIAVEKNGKMVGILIAWIQKEHAGFLGVFSARSIIFGGPLVEDNNPDILELLLKEYNKIINNKVIYSQFRNLWEWSKNEKIIFTQNGFNYEEHLNILVDLNKSYDELWSGVKKSRKEGIRKAKRNNLKFEVSNESDILPIFHKLLKKTYSNVKLPFPGIDFFEELIQIVPTDNIKIFTLKKEERVIVALVALIYNNCLSAFYIGVDRDENILKTRPVDLFYWEVLKWGSENNCTIYDWMGAGKPNVDYGVRQFKLQYGGNLVEFGRFEKKHRPILMSVAKLGLKLYKLIK